MASVIDIGIELKRLIDTVPAPRGVSMEKAFDGYVAALSSFAVEHINEAITRYLAAEFDDVSLKFYPRAPELAGLVRRVRSEHGAEAAKAKREDDLKAERREMEESRKLAVKTPEQLARADELMRAFNVSNVEARRAVGRGKRIDARNPAFVAASRDPYRPLGAKIDEDPLIADGEQADVRLRYGMTGDALASVRDRPLPKGMSKLADVVPVPPAPPADRLRHDEDFADNDGSLL